MTIINSAYDMTKKYIKMTISGFRIKENRLRNKINIRKLQTYDRK